MLEWLGSAILKKAFDSLIDWLFRRRRRGSGESAQPAVVVNPGVTLDANRLAEQYVNEARERIRAELERDRLQNENAELHKARDAAVADLQQRSLTADDPSRFERALAELEEGRPETAEALFRSILVERRTQGRAALREASRAALHIGAIAIYHDTQKALSAYEEATELDPDNAEAWNRLGELLLRVGNLGRSESVYQKLFDLGMGSDNKEVQAVALAGLGAVFGTRGDWKMAEDKFRGALKLNEELDHQEGMARNYGDIGNILLARGDLNRAEEMYRKSLALNERLGNKDIVVGIYCNLGIVFRTKGDLNAAEEMYRKSLEISEEKGFNEGMAIAYSGLGGVFLSRRNLNDAEAMCRKSLELNKGLDRKEGVASNYANLAVVHQIRGNSAEACRLWGLARRLFSEIGARDRVEQVERNMKNAGCAL